MANCKSCGAAHRKKGDTSPPSWELRSALGLENVYERKLLLQEQLCFARGPVQMQTLTFVSGKAALGAFRVNTFARKYLS
jgi:hypothetical protein